VLEKLARLRGIGFNELAGNCFCAREAEAARHLLSVASGIDSLIVGELEILGQVRKAWETAEKAGTGGPILRNLFHRAMRMGRRVRQQTNISRGNVSVAAAAVRLIGERLGGLKDRRALVIGTGKVGSQTLVALKEAGVSTLLLANRTVEKATTLAESMGCTPVSLEDMVTAITRTDIVICATGAPHHVVTREMVRQAEASDSRTRVYADLSAPPNIDPAIAGMPGVELIRLDDLQEIARTNAEMRHGEAERVQKMVDEEVAHITNWTRSAPRQRIIRDFRSTMEEIRLSHLQRHGHRYDEQTLDVIDRHTRSLVSALLHDLTGKLNSLDAETEDGRRQLELAQQLLLAPEHAEHARSE
jgi:glutamyl-tRNA reductase